MKIKVTLAIALLALLVIPGAVFAQSTPAKAAPPAISVTLEYFENNSGVFDIKDDKGVSVTDPQIGDQLKIGWTVITGKGDVAELKMTHTSTIIKLAQNTNFKLDKLRTDSGGQDVFSLAVGKVRTVAGKASTKDQYQIRTQSAVCGVRGSDVVIEYEEGVVESISTLEGTGWIQNAAGQAIDVAQGFFADALAATFQAVQIPQDVLQGLMDEMKFTKLDVNQVLEINKAWQASLQQPAEPAEGGQTPSTPPAPATSSFMDSIMEKLKDILGVEIGSVTIGGVTWSKVVVSPTFQLGNLKAALYLPVIYQGDMFNPADYYKPAGNNEWSFGTDQGSDPWKIAGDIATDLFLKIKYVEWGRQRDPFFFKVGNLNDITIGHGLIMRNFANDADFPSVRRVGVNVGMDFGGAGIEAMVNDAADPDLVGGRFFVRPVPNFKAALGVSAVVDLDPAKDAPGGSSTYGSPIFINPGVDLDIPFFESDFFSIVAFADAAGMIPYFQSAYGSIAPGFQWNAMFPGGTANPTDIRNWGVAAGLFGNLIIRDFTWRLEYRDYTGAFLPQFYGPAYERQRLTYVNRVIDFLANPGNYTGQTMGIFGEGGIALSKLFSFKMSYFWPWSQDPTTGAFNFEDDQFVATFVLEKGVIPVVNIWGTVSYERTNFIPTFIQTGSGSLFDANTVVSASVNYSVTSNLDVSLLYTTTAHRNSDGSIYYPNGPLGLPQMDISFAIQTQVHL
ncbi:MAG TPA: FecR family protein [Spirochaetia bacterium]